MNNKAVYAYPVEIKGNVFLCHLEKREMEDTVVGEYNFSNEREREFFRELLLEDATKTSIGSIIVQELMCGRDMISKARFIVDNLKNKELKLLLEVK